MSKFAQILHDQLSSEIGGVVRLLLRSGKELPGVIDQVEEDFVVLKRRGSRATTIVLDEIAAFDFPDGTMPVEESEVEESERWSLSHPVLNAAPTVPLDQPLPKLGIEVFKRLEELTARFERKMQQAKVDVVAPDPRTPLEELRALGEREAVPIWVSIKNRFDNAARVNELGPKYGRIQGIIGSLKDLIEEAPAAPSLKRYLAYFQYLTDNKAAALSSAEEAALTSQSARDWLMVAAFAVMNTNDALACHALEQVFQRHALTENGDVWYVYVGLLRGSGNYALLHEIYEARHKSDPPTFSESEEQLLLDACLYLLHYSGKDEVALDILRQSKGGMPAKTLIPQAINWLVGQVGPEYRHMALKMKAAQEAALQELRGGQAAIASASLNGVGEEKKQVALSVALSSTAPSTPAAAQSATLSTILPAQSPPPPMQPAAQQLIWH